VLDKYENKTKADPPFVYILEWEGPTSKQKFSRIDHLSKQKAAKITPANKRDSLLCVFVIHSTSSFFSTRIEEKLNNCADSWGRSAPRNKCASFPPVVSWDGK
jgi:hypothetical protein